MELKGVERVGDIEINLWDILNILLKKVRLIVLVTIPLTISIFVISRFFITPEYTAVTKMYVMTQQDHNMLTQGDMQTSTFLAKDYAEMIKSRTVTEEVIKQLKLDMASNELLKKVDIKIATDTRVMTISASDSNPQKAADIANLMREISSEHIKSVMDTEAVNTVEAANVPMQPSSPKILINTLVGGAIGILITMAIIVVSALASDTIQISDDIEKYLDMSVLGVIPKEVEKYRPKKRGSIKNKRKRELRG